MKKKFEILKSNCQKYSCIVIPTFCFNPLSNIENLPLQLDKEHVKPGTILFDLIIPQGNSNERYATMQFNEDGNLLRDSFAYISVDNKDPIRKVSSDFLRLNLHYTNVSMLSNSQISLLKNGYIL